MLTIAEASNKKAPPALGYPPNSVVYVFMCDFCFILLVVLCTEPLALCQESHSL